MPIFSDNGSITEQQKGVEFVRSFLESQKGAPCRDLEVRIRRLRGGLESLGVWLVRTDFLTTEGKKERHAFVLKRTSRGGPEARIYGEVLPGAGLRLAPALLALEEHESAQLYFLEFVRPALRWPWAQQENSRRVLMALANLHEKKLNGCESLDYEEILRRESAGLVEHLERMPRGSVLNGTRKSLPAVRRMVEALPKVRRQLLETGPLGRTLIHGDVHSANVLLRRGIEGLSPVFLDWGRSRSGSPFEDVSSWLQSLGCWEPEAKRRHDTLLRDYVAARELKDQLTESIRGAYWLSAACNVLAGAAMYHFSVANDPVMMNRRAGEQARRALRDCLRIVQRADSYWS